MRRTEALQGVRMGGVFESSPPLGISGAEPGRGGGAFGGCRADLPAVDAPLQGRGRGGLARPAAWQGVGQASPERPGRGSGAALSRALPRLYGEALSRASGDGPRLRLGLHLDEAASSVEGRGRKGAAQGGAPQKARAASAAGRDAASGRVAPRLARGRAGARPDRHLRRCDGIDLFGVSGRGGRRGPRPSGRSRRFSAHTGRP